MARSSALTKFPVYAWFGIVLIIVFWILNWTLDGLRTHILFFPQWLGYCLFIDGLVYVRKGTSLLNRSVKRYIGLYIISAPVWWLFELLNAGTQNWIYLARDQFTNLEYFLYATLDFSTVIPAVFGTAEFVSTFSWVKFSKPVKIFKSNHMTVAIFFILGWIMLALMLTWPNYLYVFMWISIFFIIDPINFWLGNRTLVEYSGRKNWKPMIALAIGCLICGFFWEMWNFYAYPKWIYDVPGLNYFHIFEMPLTGYLGYIPFSFELFGIYHLLTRTRSGLGSYYVELE
ncbi:hypothetical protein ACFLU5_08180 [Bacteroidota bacterium]